MLERLPTVLTAQEILDKAYRKSNKLEVPDPVKYHRVRKTIAAKCSCLTDTVRDSLGRYTIAMGTIDHLPGYEQEVLDIVVGLPRLRKALGTIQWAHDKVVEIGRSTQEKMNKARDMDRFEQIRKACGGRISSVVNEADEALTILAETRAKAKLLPTVHPGYETVVIAGFPNVGKSSLLRAWTGARAEVNEYAFTTKQANVGHMEIPGDPPRTIQFVDTPGLLDRPDEERNDVERQAVAALHHVSDAVVFLVDPAEHCGFQLPDQERLLAQVQEEMHGIPIVIAYSKCDVLKVPGKLSYSTLTGEGLEELQRTILAALPSGGPTLEEDPLDRWKQ